MEKIPPDTILEFNPDTLQDIRKQYDLDKPERIEEAINILEEWLKKQEHFMKKEFSRGYLERTIIFSKGSVERAKVKLDKLCTLRTICPNFFGVYDIKNCLLLNEMYGGFLPKLTSNHHRVFAFRNIVQHFDKGINEFYRYFFMQCEYIQARDYCNGLVMFLDYRDANIMETAKVLNIVDMRDCFRILKEGFRMRINAIHFLSESKAIEVIVSLLKQVLSAKLGERIMTHKTMDTIYEHIPKDILPVEYGGKEMPLFELHRKYQEVMSSEEFTDYLTEMTKACTDERLRTTQIPDQLMGPEGSFRTLSVD